MKLAASLNRLGTESAFSVLAEAKKLEAAGNPMIHLGLGQPDFKTPKHVVEAAKKALDDGHHGYVLSNGILECRQAVTRWIKKRYNAEVDPERITIMPGGKPTMHYAIQCFGEPGAEIIHPTPAFPIYESMINYTGSTAVPYDLTEDKDLKFSADKILSLITDKTRLLILINPNNPTGSFVEKSEIDKLAEGLKKHPHVTILSDEIYSRQIFDGKEMPTFFNYPELRDRLIVLEGWSKAYSMTGWRLGWSFWPENLIEHVNKLLINSVSCVNAAAQFAGIAALDGSDDSIHLMMEKFTQRRKLIHEGLNSLPGIECSLPGGAFYAFPKVIGTGMDGSEFCKRAMHEAGVAIVPGTAFGKTSKDYVRFSFAASQDNISNALENIKKMLG
ncbi:aminotransferase class I/II-fold pyridoxal phosphate-dependent enzyme [Candidatus Pelagibacter bacterium]|jgi:aspartate aminotransferase|nr:aminotransferase class I/II-fold pyridoxal phosphate-dependent enzyme [Candidatus Pelagibacter sp.]MDB2441871.1 aminotransferase class I/II-fold pyridoxal phosphate-dependent enzyme [Candidatus Pelagibacter bacterium]MDA7547133.1 aminotransferase class I/II-fold pyridoxal phosphate-dependent enzyme [Candidatus Pelagibacter sp.]MDA9788988.1 aminotransferase class I/II-fold pyridoxal phosphate-dependent enzyme [Candidatus Pelagibacter sp.]MDB2545125.1 aminotransferase class I/II-fold pyridoxal